MLRAVSSGAVAIEPIPGAPPGHRLVRVAVAQDIVIELPMDPEFCVHVAERLMMEHDELESTLTREREEVERAGLAPRIHVPGRPDLSAAQ